jgi:hypothetical protein
MGQEFDDEGIICGNGDPENADQAAAIEDAFTNSFANRVTEEFTGTFSGHFKLLTAAQQAVANSVFGTSLDASGVYLSDFTGVENRPFTLAFALPAILSLELGVSSVYLINCGTFNPRTPLLIHELTHVWQSQHHLNPFQYIQNSLDSQAQAISFNLVVGSTDPRFPFSPYAYVPGKAFSEYAAEQIAKQVERGEAAIVQHVANVAAFAEDTDNETGLATARCENKTVAGVQF